MPREVKDFLKRTDKSMAEIGRITGYSSRTVRNINLGRTHFDPSESYPLRVTGQMSATLKERLSIPNKLAVPRPNILSPQLIDYIGFLSLIGAEESCILEFKEVYIEQLEGYFNKELNDNEILSIISLRPAHPKVLKDLIDAYEKPNVRFINNSYWLKTGFISASEEKLIISLIARN